MGGLHHRPTTPADLAFLRTTGTPISAGRRRRAATSSRELRHRLPSDTAPETCFGSTANAERRRRAEQLAARLGVTANNIALGWVLAHSGLAQGFPSLALVGPRTVEEINSTLPACGVGLGADEVSWLNLEAGSA